MFNIINISIFHFVNFLLDFYLLEKYSKLSNRKVIKAVKITLQKFLFVFWWQDWDIRKK